jgi:hypothetical protein
MHELTVYVGYDAREHDAYEVCKRSLLAHSPDVTVIPLKADELRADGLFWREYREEGSQKYDVRDGKPFSTDFSFTRFLVPAIHKEGFALFCDCDFLFRDDVRKLPLYRESAVSVVKHVYQPGKGTKMDGQKQENYPRKNWSSFMLWNCDHPANRTLTPDVVNFQSGSWLHALKWLMDYEIGNLDEKWNWIAGSSKGDRPSAVHFTTGTPAMPGYENVPFADEWRSYR